MPFSQPRRLKAYSVLFYFQFVFRSEEMVEPSTSNVNEATAQDTDEDQSKSIMEVEESNEAVEKSSVPTSSSAEPAITTASNVSKVREHT